MLYLCETIALLLVILLVVTQIIIPAGQGTSSFPAFRAEKKILDSIEEAKQSNREKELQALLNKEKERQ